MDETRQYIVVLDKENEAILRSFLLDYTDILRITRADPWLEIHFFRINKFGHDDDPKYIAGQQSIRQDLFRKVASHRHYNDVYAGKRRRFIHLYYHLSIPMKQLLNKEILNFNVESKTFYGFEDPVFYRGDNIICAIMTLKNRAICNLNDAQVKYLVDNGLKLSPMR